MERDNKSTQDHETDDEEPSDCSDDDEVREGCDGSAPTNNACIYAENDGGHPVCSSSASAAWQKRERSASPAAATPPQKKSKSAKKHKKARIERAEQREREGHVPRTKVIQRKIQEGTGVKTALDSEKLPAAHGAYVAKNFPEKCAGKEYLPEDLNTMGFTCIPWDGM